MPAEFHYQDPFPLGPDTTEYRLLTKDHVSVAEFDGRPVLKVAPQALTLLANQALHDINFHLRTAHLEQVAAILADPDASDNDRSVALAMLRNAEVAAKGVRPFCQDTGTAQVVAKKGQQVWTGGGDAEALSLGVYQAYAQNNLRYSQMAPLDMYAEKNTGTNLPAQVDISAADGMKYEFLFVAKGGGSANKCYLYQETKAVLNPKSLVKFLTEKMQSLGTAACPPYHLAFVIGGTSAEATMKAVKLASTHYYDALPTSGNEHGRAFRDAALEAELLKAAHGLG
ncbi:MAG: fumarate hydratase, partial [Opitutia bacterium]